MQTLESRRDDERMKQLIAERDAAVAIKDWKVRALAAEINWQTGISNIPPAIRKPKPSVGLSTDHHERIMQLPMQTRQGAFNGVGDDRQIHFSFSSDTPVQRKFGRERLSHAPGALRTERLDRGVVPLLKDHSWTLQAGKVLGYQLGEHRNYATARLFTTPLGEELLREIKEGRTEVSLGYLIHKMELTEETPGQENNLYTVVDYEVCEISSVSVPADPTVGVNRSLSEQLDGRVYACRVMSPGSGEIMWGERQEIEEEIRREFFEKQEAERIRLRDEKCEKIQSEGYFLF
jgi:hypothetical protein